MCEHTNCKKVIGTCIVSCPKLLVVQLMRFAYVAGQQVRNSSNVLPNMEIDLSLCYTTSILTAYRLRSVIVHDGRSVHSGHYTTLMISGNNYIHLNDHTVKEMSVFDFAKLASSAGYLFFYERIDEYTCTPPSLDSEIIIFHSKRQRREINQTFMGGY